LVTKRYIKINKLAIFFFSICRDHTVYLLRMVAGFWVEDGGG